MHVDESNPSRVAQGEPTSEAVEDEGSVGVAFELNDHGVVALGLDVEAWAIDGVVDVGDGDLDEGLELSIGDAVVTVEVSGSGEARADRVRKDAPLKL